MLKKTYPYYLANQPQTSKDMLDVRDKFSGKLATRVAVPDARATEKAIAAAVKAAKPMREYKPWARQAVLQHCAQRFAERRDELAEALCIEAGKPIVIFPAGRLARLREGVLTDPEWMASAASIARKYALPIVPCHVAGPYAFWFHTFSKFSAELRDITLFHELLNKRGKTYELTVGPGIPPEHSTGDATQGIRRIKYYVERVLPNAPDIAFDPEGPECPWRDPPKADGKSEMKISP